MYVRQTHKKAFDLQNRRPLSLATYNLEWRLEQTVCLGPCLKTEPGPFRWGSHSKTALVHVVL